MHVENFVPSVGCARNQTSVSQSSTESEIISLDAGLRMDGLLALFLDLWNVVTEVFVHRRIPNHQHIKATGNCSRNHKSKPKQKGNRDVDQLSHVECLTTNAYSSQGEVSVVHL